MARSQECDEVATFTLYTGHLIDDLLTLIYLSFFVDFVFPGCHAKRIYL